jgi:CheY-like chemotaxis protein
MTKIMLVEDDKSLREIYGIRLVAEGYNIISAGDGEEALAMVVQEKPDLIIADVMMPKISGFDMLDILRATPETKDIKVIMMTALSSEDQRKRGESLGANKYLVKSQVGIEDVINAVHEVLSDRPNTNGQANINTLSNIQNATVSQTPTPAPTVPTPPPVPAAPVPAPTPVIPTQPMPPVTPTPAPAPTPTLAPAPLTTPPPAPGMPASPQTPPPMPVPTQPIASAQPTAPIPTTGVRNIQPISNPAAPNAGPSTADRMAAELGQAQ